MAQGVPGRLRPRIFLTFRHYKGGRSSAILTGHLYPRRNPWYSLSEAESTSGHMVLSEEPRKKSPVTLPAIDPGTDGLVAQCLNHYATPGPGGILVLFIYIYIYVTVIEGKIKGEIEVARRRGRRRKKLLDDLKDRRGYCHLKEEALDRTLWRHRFGGGFGPVVRHSTE